MIKKTIISLLLISSLFIAFSITWIYSKIDSALPLLNGKEIVLGLHNTAVIERDSQGIATIKAKSRIDIAVATGFIHAQERFFQMDLLRRNSAGELASLFGALALNYDKSIRRHRFRERAASIVNNLPSNQRALLKAYTLGVNQGLMSLGAQPFEYLILQQEPTQWSEEDSILTIFSMYIDLQYHDGQRERSLGLMKATLSSNVYAFLNPKGSIWDAAIDNSQFQPSPVPTNAWPSASTAYVPSLPTTVTHSANIAVNRYQADEFPGSNSWAISGDMSSTGSAIIANDMHLGIRVPNTWFRASFEYLANNKPVKVTGATLPGTPNIVVGSNGNIAWGFTNSYGDYSDIVILNTINNAKQYLTPSGAKDFSYHKQIIAIKDEQPVEITIKETIWGPVIGKNH
ncbi:MAG: penicillin acylase family protein, partial [Colwellia sp.]|nr:penicillin acylase family protein [Colwellia sp.]